MKKQFMKKSSLILAAALSAFALWGCGSSAEETTGAPTEAQAQATEAAASTSDEGASAESGADTDTTGGGRLDAILDAGVITMATSPDFAPYEFEDISSGTTEYAGSDIELGKYIAEKLGVELQIEAMDFNACLAAASTGAVDMSISGFAYTEERAEQVGMSDGYNVTPKNGNALLILKDKAEELSTKESFAGKTIAVQNASLQQQLRQQQLPDANEEVVTNLNDGIMMLITGRVDAVVCAMETAEQYTENYPDITASEFVLDYENDGSRVVVQKGEDALLEAINEIIAEVNEAGLYQEWLDEATELASSLGLETN